MTENIKNIIEKFELGYVFTVSDFPMTAENPKSVNKILNHFVATGYLRKLVLICRNIVPNPGQNWSESA